MIFVSADTFAAFQSAGAIRALDDLAPAEMLDGLAGVDQFVLAGTLWAVPLYQQMVMIDYDTTSLDAIGLTAADIATWDDFEAAMLAMKEQGLYEYPYAARHPSLDLVPDRPLLRLRAVRRCRRSRVRGSIGPRVCRVRGA